jgi:hypothetical protein
VSGEVSVRFLDNHGNEDDAIVRPFRCGAVVITREPINLKRAKAAIEAIGGVKVHSLSDFKKHDVERTVGEILQGFVDRVVCIAPYCSDIGWIWSAFKESGFASRQGLKARLVAGCKVDEIPQVHGTWHVATRLKAAGMGDYDITRGVFALPRELKHILRCDIHGAGFLAAVDIDLQGSHPRAVLKRLEARGSEAGPSCRTRSGPSRRSTPTARSPRSS